MLIDSHAHLNDEKFDEDREELIQSLKAKGIELILNLGDNPDASIKSVELAKKYDFIYAAVGTHPSDADSFNDETISLYKRLVKENCKVIGIGEIGLDYYYDEVPREIQKKCFIEQIRLAKTLDIPYIVHDRDAHEDVYNIMKQEYYSGARGILHCYSGSVELAKEFIKMGFMIALGGVVTFKNAKTAKRVAQEIPLEYLLIETDSPYLAPEPYRGTRNNPAYVRNVAEQIAILRNISYDKVVEQTNKNFKRLFNIV